MIEEWPRNRLIASGWTPWLIKIATAVWRRSCTRRPAGSPAARTAGRQTLELKFELRIGDPLLAVNNRASGSGAAYVTS
ncbi:MAG: hypothetical protein WAN34_02530 [Acidimicrobiia bacterium]